MDDAFKMLMNNGAQKQKRPTKPSQAKKNKEQKEMVDKLTVPKSVLNEPVTSPIPLPNVNETQSSSPKPASHEITEVSDELTGVQPP